MRILDLCCGEGGAAMGYKLAADALGIPVEITGVDIHPKKYYPFNFVLADAVEFGQVNAHKFDFIHASPPCQMFSNATAFMRAKGKTYPEIIGPIREIIETSGKPGVIENVPNAPIRPDVKLWGDLFHLGVIRERWFELIGWWMLSPERPAKRGSVKNGDYVTITGNAAYRNYKQLPVGWRPKFDQGTALKTWQYAMGMSWVKSDTGIAEAIPPAYTQYIFTEFLMQQ